MVGHQYGNDLETKLTINLLPDSAKIMTDSGRALREGMYPKCSYVDMPLDAKEISRQTKTFLLCFILLSLFYSK